MWKRLAAPTLIQPILLFVLTVVLLSMVTFGADGFFDEDSYYHVRAATEIVEQGRLALDFPWLPLTILDSAHFTDHHLLLHIFLIPWVSVAGINGAKLAMVIIVGAVVVTIWVLLRALKVRWAVVWAFALLSLSSNFFLRLLAARAQAPSLLLLIIALGLLLTKRYRWLIVLGFAYTWLYDGFVLLLVFAMIYVLAVWISERQLAWKAVGFTILGIALGLVINPYFPVNVSFIISHLIAKVNIKESIRVGTEWYAYSTSWWLTIAGGSLLALGLGIVYPSFSTRRRDTADTTLLLVALLTLIMMFISNRFIEYYPAFALLFCSVTWGRGDVDLLALLPSWLRLRWLAGALGVLVVVGLAAFYLHQAYAITVERTRPLDVRTGASNWLRENTPEGALVFNEFWDDFPRLFYQNTHNTYLVGLDPTYLQLANPTMWDDYDAIRKGAVEHPAAQIISEFGAEYMLTDRTDEVLSKVLDDDPSAHRVYEDADGIVWKLDSEPR